jgi:hypothetical protein
MALSAEEPAGGEAFCFLAELPAGGGSVAALLVVVVVVVVTVITRARVVRPAVPYGARSREIPPFAVTTAATEMTTESYTNGKGIGPPPRHIGLNRGTTALAGAAYMYTS